MTIAGSGTESLNVDVVQGWTRDVEALHFRVTIQGALVDEFRIPFAPEADGGQSNTVDYLQCGRTYEVYVAACSGENVPQGGCSPERRVTGSTVMCSPPRR